MKKTLLTIFALASVAMGSNAQTFTLSQCLKKGLENNYSLRITRNEEQKAHNNATLANAGYLPSIDLSAGYNGDLSSSNATLRSTGETDEVRNALDHTLNANVGLSWTIFDGFNTSTTYKQLKEMERMGETSTRIAIEDFIASLTSEYYNFIRQRLRLNNYYNAQTLPRELHGIVVVVQAQALADEIVVFRSE